MHCDPSLHFSPSISAATTPIAPSAGQMTTTITIPAIALSSNPPPPTASDEVPVTTENVLYVTNQPYNQPGTHNVIITMA